MEASGGSKANLKGKRSVTWDPALDGSQSGPSVKASARCEPHIPRPNSYHIRTPDRVSELKEHNLDTAEALDAIELEFSRIRQDYLEFYNRQSNPIDMYNLGRESQRLQDLLVTKVLLQLESMEVENRDKENRWKRKALLTEANDLLELVNDFLKDHQTSPIHNSSEDIRSEDVRSTQQQEESKPLPVRRSGKAGAASSRNSRPLPDPYLGRRIASLTPEELRRGAIRRYYYLYEKYDSAGYISSANFEKFYFEVPSRSKPGDLVEARLERPRNTFEDSAYFHVELVLDEDAHGPDRNQGSHRRSANHPSSHDRDNRVPPSQTRHRSEQHDHHGDSAKEEQNPHHRRGPPKSILKNTQTDKSMSETRRRRYDYPSGWDDDAHVPHDHMRVRDNDDEESASSSSDSSRSSRDSRYSYDSRERNRRRNSRRRESPTREPQLRNWFKDSVMGFGK